MMRTRYPGVRPFEKEEKSLFFGRNKDIQELYNLVLLEKIVVLFGKSGYGKSSLINAGLLPKFENPETQTREQYLPIRVRFKDFNSAGQNTPLSTLISGVEEIAKPAPEAAYLDHWFKDDPGFQSLWMHFKRRQQSRQSKYILFFDQFEEFFTYPEADRLAFKSQLSELLFTKIPQRIYDQSDEVSEADFKHLVTPIEIKALFCVRSDRLHLLDYLKDMLPGILQKRYELRGLSRAEAIDSIRRPAALLQSDGFSSPPFDYTDESIEQIYQKLTDQKNKHQDGIEAFQLQMVCGYLEGRVKDGFVDHKDADGNLLITADDLPDFDSIYEKYYEDRLRELPSEKIQAARLLIEEGLLYIDLNTREARRLSVDGDFLIKQFSNAGADRELLPQLERTYLVRREANSLGGYNYEISHDTLLGPLTKYKSDREAKEAILKTEQERRFQAEQLHILHKKRMRARRIAIYMSLLAATSLLALEFAITQYKKASVREQEAKTALERFLLEKDAKERLQIKQLIQGAETYEKANESGLALRLLEQALAIDSSNIQIKIMMDSIRNTLHHKNPH